jgi:hypothetical protein
MVILTDCDLFERLCPGQIGMLTHRFVTIWRSLYHAEILADLISAEHKMLFAAAPMRKTA